MQNKQVHYSELGLVNTREMFARAMAGKYAIPAYNFNNLEQLQAIVVACAETNSPVIIQVSKGARSYAKRDHAAVHGHGSCADGPGNGFQYPDLSASGSRRFF